MTQKPKILIQGIGAVGGVIAGEMIRAGYRPTLVSRNQEIAHAINNHGLKVTTPEHSFSVNAHVLTSLDEIDDDTLFDIVFLIMKTDAVVEAAQQVAPLLAPDGFLVPFQNGFVEDALAPFVGRSQIVSASVAFGAVMNAPGEYERATEGSVFVGELNGKLSARVSALSDVLQNVTSVYISPSIVGMLWGKLAWNCAVSGLCAISGFNVGELLDDRRGRILFLLIYREVLETAKALDIKLEPIVINHVDYYVPRDATPQEWELRDTMVKMLIPKYGKVKPSSLQDLERGRNTETDYITGYLVERAQSVDVEAHINAALSTMISEIEQSQRQITPDNLDALLKVMDTVPSEDVLP